MGSVPSMDVNDGWFCFHSKYIIIIALSMAEMQYPGSRNIREKRDTIWGLMAMKNRRPPYWVPPAEVQDSRPLLIVWIIQPPMAIVAKQVAPAIDSANIQPTTAPRTAAKMEINTAFQAYI